MMMDATMLRAAPVDMVPVEMNGGGSGGGWAALTSSPAPLAPPPAWVGVTSGGDEYVSAESSGGCTGCGSAPRLTPPPGISPDIIVSVGTRDWVIWLLIGLAILAALYFWGR